MILNLKPETRNCFLYRFVHFLDGLVLTFGFRLFQEIVQPLGQDHFLFHLEESPSIILFLGIELLLIDLFDFLQVEDRIFPVVEDGALGVGILQR